ncbi:hypothetical protein MPSEU_000296400 [Mayamaea pseudoterrestris]|nr:hypothetical protein MPSEU_000296400 [Mayamaea pseudoterrestris]
MSTTLQTEHPMVQQAASVASIVQVSEYDVVLGRASGTQGHQGNFRYRAICHTAATWYHAARGNPALKRAIVVKVIKDVEPGRFLKRLNNGLFVQVEGKERYTKVQTDLRTGRIGRMMNKTLEIPKAQIDAAVAALSVPEATCEHLQSVARPMYSPRPSNASGVMRTVSTGDDYPATSIADNHHSTVLAKMKLEAEYLELTKEKEVLVMQNKILELKKDLQGLRDYNRKLESGGSDQDEKGEGDLKDTAIEP